MASNASILAIIQATMMASSTKCPARQYPLTILFLSATAGSRVHDKCIAATPPYPLPAGSRLLQDLGFLAFTLP